MANAAPASSGTPSHLGRYELLTQLGEGGMSQVYLAVQRGSVADKLVVVKLLREQFSSDDQFVAMFADESRIAVRLSHPNVIHTYEASATESRHYIVMEFLEAKTLAQLLRRVGRKNVPLATHLWVLCEVLSGLGYAHQLVDFDGAALQIVHRDVSPSNVLCTIRGEVKLVDFGIAKAVGAIAHTQHGMIKGKLGYASPEQCLGDHADGRADIYAVGVMLWEALAGQRRSHGESILATIRARVQASEVDIAEVFPAVPPRLAAITRRALAANPAERYPSALAFERDLRQYLSDAGAPNGALQLQTLVSEYFGGELAEIRGIIDQQVRPSAPGALPGRMSSWPGAQNAPLGSSSAPPHVLAHDLPLPVSSRTRNLRRAAATAGVAAVVALVAMVYARSDAQVAPRAVARADVNPTQPIPALRSTSPVASVSDSLPPVAPEVRLRVSALPPSVRLRLDGVEQRNPLQAALRRDDKDHVLLAEANGYMTESHTIHFDRDLDLRLTLEPRRSVSWRRPSNAYTSSALLPSATAPKPEVVEPGADLRKPSRPPNGRSLDESDPYAP